LFFLTRKQNITFFSKKLRFAIKKNKNRIIYHIRSLKTDFTRREKYSSKLDISHSFISIFVAK